MPQKRTTKAGKVYWVGRVRIPGRGEVAESFPTRRQAVAFEVDTKADLAKGKWVEPKAGKITVAELVTQWAATSSAPSTRKSREDLAKNLGTLTDMHVQAVRPADLNTWIDQLEHGRPWAGGRPYAPSTIRLMRGQLSGVFTRAVDDSMIAKSPFTRGVAVPPLTDDLDDEGVVDRLLTADEIDTLVAAALYGTTRTETYREGRRTVKRTRRTLPNPALAAMILVACGTGMRVGEVAGLKLSNPDREGGIIQVRQQAKTTATGFRKLKTPRSRRDLPAAGATFDVIDDYLEAFPQPDRYGPIFRTSRGNMWSNKTVAAALRNLRAPTGIGWVTFHDFRHYYASALIGGGLSPKAVADLLGHSSPTVTLEVYAHLWPAEVELARSAVEALPVLRGDRGDTPRPDLRVV